jgi:hypothetical protein
MACFLPGAGSSMTAAGDAAIDGERHVADERVMRIT